jgi:multidrug resistance efflux pump
MRRFYIVLLIALAAVVLMTAYYKSETYRFYGIADTKEIVVNYNLPVEIKKINVVQGQPIRAGDTLVVLDQPELTMKINTISHSLEELKATKATQATRSRSEIRQIQAEQIARVNEIKAEIKKLEAEYDLNKKLMSELRSVSKNGRDVSDTSEVSNPILVEIAELKKVLEVTKNPSQIVIDRLNGEISSNEDPLVVQVERMTKELTMLNEEKERLVILAQIDGVIGSVNFKEREKVSPYDTIMTLHRESPSYVRGYIHENVHSSVTVGQSVSIRSMADSYTSDGDIVGVGSRIVEYPIRLRKIQDVVMWGKEVLVRIPDDNKFLLGEKVVISVPYGKAKSIVKIFFSGIFNSKVHAGVRSGGQSGSAIIPKIEASGVVYLRDLQQYLVISDETVKKKPALFIHDLEGNFIRDAMIEGLESINDMESITEGDDGKLYIAASQSVNKSGIRADNRKLFIRVRRQGDSFKVDGKIDLVDALLGAAGRNKDEWARFIRQAVIDSTIDIEGMFFDNGSICLGFKQPLLDNNAVVLKIRNVNDIFETQRIQSESISLWRKILLPDSAHGVFSGVSDMLLKNNLLYILTCSEKDTKPLNCGAAWAYDTNTGTSKLLKTFPGLRPEGITYNNDSDEYFIAFDGGADGASKFTTLKGVAQ